MAMTVERGYIKLSKYFETADGNKELLSIRVPMTCTHDESEFSACLFTPDSHNRLTVVRPTGQEVRNEFNKFFNNLLKGDLRQELLDMFAPEWYWED